jgi:methyl-accepting chemotaxis protein
LQATAQTLSENAARTMAGRSGAAAGVDEASVNVQAVASASEELAASIAEISRRVADSSRVSARAADDAWRTDGVVRNLAGC